jgi:hypothetical protein
MERCIRKFVTFDEAEQEGLREWMELSGTERLGIGEAMREECFPDHEPGLQRVLCLVEHEAG